MSAESALWEYGSIIKHELVRVGDGAPRSHYGKKESSSFIGHLLLTMTISSVTMVVLHTSTHEGPCSVGACSVAMAIMKDFRALVDI